MLCMSSDLAKSMGAFFHEASFEMSELVESITVKTFQKVDGRYENPLHLTGDVHWTTVASRQEGRCYSAKIQNKYTDRGKSLTLSQEPILVRTTSLSLFFFHCKLT